MGYPTSSEPQSGKFDRFGVFQVQRKRAKEVEARDAERGRIA